MKLSNLLSLAVVALLPLAAHGYADVCEQHSAAAAQRHAVPPQLMQAIARVESGRAHPGVGLRAWPWTANVVGQGYYFETSQAALTFLDGVRAQGQTSFDVGCMQLNYRWHGDKFQSLSQMLDPARNTDYAARYLAELYQETGDWNVAARYYHSRTPEFGHAYLARVQQVMSGGEPPRVAAVIQAGLPMHGAAIPMTGSGPLIAMASARAYWDIPALDPGNRPVLPD
jgi:hypothetical protein